MYIKEKMDATSLILESIIIFCYEKSMNTIESIFLLLLKKNP